MAFTPFTFEKCLYDRGEYPYTHKGVLDVHPIGVEDVLTTADEGYVVGEAVTITKTTGAVTKCAKGAKPDYIMAEAITAAGNATAHTLDAYRILPGMVWRVSVNFSSSAIAIVKDTGLEIDQTNGSYVTDVKSSTVETVTTYGCAKVVDVLDANTDKTDGDEILVTFEDLN